MITIVTVFEWKYFYDDSTRQTSIIPLHSDCQLFILIYVQEEESQIHYASQRSIYSNITALLKWQCSCFVAEYAKAIIYKLRYNYSIWLQSITFQNRANPCSELFILDIWYGQNLQTPREKVKDLCYFVVLHKTTKKVSSKQFWIIYINFSNALYYIPIL